MRGAVAVLLAAGNLACAAPVAAQGKGDEIPGIARGVLRAEREAVMSSPLSERILRMPYKEGEVFPKGAELVAFDCDRLAAELKAARASEAAESRNVQMQADLLEKGAAGKAEADIAVEREKEKRAQADAIVQRMVSCRIEAPFAGRVVEMMAHAHEVPQPNKELIRIVSSGALELYMVLPSRWLAWLKIGSAFRLRVDETGDVIDARVTRISAAVDPVSQTVKVVGAVARVPARVLPGMSGQASFSRTQAARDGS
ncbi:MAG TPA: HlyD family efflux transporter periplasmic adaptor subunit [Burkholderiales bacterium]|nr:HlyD family efflux transporter periplasmic adaptor subunit [Burkholderiales bacterium]